MAKFKHAVNSGDVQTFLSLIKEYGIDLEHDPTCQKEPNLSEFDNWQIMERGKCITIATYLFESSLLRCWNGCRSLTVICNAAMFAHPFSGGGRSFDFILLCVSPKIIRYFGLSPSEDNT